MKELKSTEQEDWVYVKSKMRDEGFHYCFMHYSSFPEIQDEKFHKLRKKYLKASLKLEKHINKKIENQFDIERDPRSDPKGEPGEIGIF